MTGAMNGENGKTQRQQSGLARVMANGDAVEQDDYKPTSILLTGGAGFIGSHVAILLAKKYPEKHQRRRRWLSRKKAAAKVAEPELKRMIRDFDPR